MAPEKGPYEPPAVVDLGSLAELTAGAGMGMRDDSANDSAGKT